MCVAAYSANNCEFMENFNKLCAFWELFIKLLGGNFCYFLGKPRNKSVKLNVYRTHRHWLVLVGFIFGSFLPKHEFLYTNTGGRKNAENTFDIPFNTSEFSRKLFAYFFHFCHFLPTKQTENRVQQRSSLKLMFVLIKKNVQNIFFSPLHYIIFTIFHLSPFPTFVVYTKLCFFHVFPSFRPLKNPYTKIYAPTRLGPEYIPHFLLLLYCVTSDDFF